MKMFGNGMNIPRLWNRGRKKLFEKQGKTHYVSRLKILGMPLLHISNETARGLVAIGDNATGLVAIGRHRALGLVSVGFYSIGMVAAGVFAVGLTAAAGVFSFSFGNSAGALSAGNRAAGALAIGRHPHGAKTWQMLGSGKK